jgi:DNA repair photolyase
MISISFRSARSLLTKSAIEGVDYCINPYVGCAHGCRYCYATFMKRFTGHSQPWGRFVDVKINAPEVLSKEIKRIRREAVVLISSVTDPYQPLEAKYMLTRKCLQILSESELSLRILTKSPLILRDIDLFKKFKSIKVGLTITTDNEKIRRIFEPGAPPIELRIKALKRLYSEGLSPYVFIGPLLPMNPARLAERLIPYVDEIMIDRMNYTYKTEHIYRRLGFQKWLDNDFLQKVIQTLNGYFQNVQDCYLT